VGHRWVTREQYVKYFTMASEMLNPTGPTEKELCCILEVRAHCTSQGLSLHGGLLRRRDAEGPLELGFPTYLG
jgi:hypothetical protein